MAESIKVVVRFRGNEEDNNQYASGTEWQFQGDEKTLQIPQIGAQSKTKDSETSPSTFTFDHVLDQNASQEKMYRIGIMERFLHLDKVVQGKLIPCLVLMRLWRLQKKEQDKKIKLFLLKYRRFMGSFLEPYLIYSRKSTKSLNNLLATNPQAQSGLKIREQKNGSVMVLNCDPVYATCPEDIFQILMVGQRNRAIASTNQNERSSRSHTIVVIEYSQKNPDGSMKTAKLNLVDLAGSERISKTGATGKTLEEAKESLGGNSKTTLICTASKKKVHVEESIQTLHFAQRAKKIKNKAITNVIKSPKELEQLIQKLKLEVQSLKKQMMEMGINPSLKMMSSPDLDIVSSLQQNDSELSTLLDISDSKSNLRDLNESMILPSSNQQLLQQGEDLTLKLTELQNQYEYYKEYADTRIMEQEDQIERFKAQNESKEELMNKIQGQKFVIQDLDDEIKRLKKSWEKERNANQTQIQSLDNHLQAKDLIFKDLEQHNEELRMKLDFAGFNIFDKIKKKIYQESFQNQLKHIESMHDKNAVESIQKDVDVLEAKYTSQEQRISKLQDENQKLKTRIKQMEFFKQQDPQNKNMSNQQYINNQNESFSQTEIMSIHSGDNDNVSENHSVNQSQIFQQNLQTLNIAQQTPKSSFKSIPNGLANNRAESSMHSKQSFGHSGSFSSVYTQGQSFFRTTYKQSKQITTKLMDLTVDNLKLIQINQKLMNYINSLSTTKDVSIQEQISKSILIEAELQDMMFQRQYLEQALQEKKQSRPDYQLQEQYQRSLEKVKLLELEVIQLKDKCIDLEEEVQQLKKLSSEMKKEKNLHQLEQAKIIRDSVKQILQQKQRSVIKSNNLVRGGARGIITSKVNINDDLLSQQSYHDDFSESELRQQMQGREKLDMVENKLRNPPSIKPQTGNISFNFFKDIDPLGGGNTKRQEQNLMQQSVEMSYKSKNSTTQANSSIKGIIGQSAKLVGISGSKKTYNDIIQMANPDHDGIIKTFHGKGAAKDYLGELDQLLNDDSDNDDDDSDEEVKKIDDDSVDDVQRIE
eukprot:403334167